MVLIVVRASRSGKNTCSGASFTLSRAMKVIIASLLLATVTIGHAQTFIFPDEYEALLSNDGKNNITDDIPGVIPLQQPEYDRFPPSSMAFQPPLIPTPAVPVYDPLSKVLPPRWRNHVMNIISSGVTKFALDMDRTISGSGSMQRPDQNLVFSPISLTTTLALVLLASGGKTFDEVAKILGLESGVDISRHSEVVHQILGIMIAASDIKQDPSFPEAKFAFGMFVQNDFPIREQFRQLSERIYKSEVINLDFLNRGREAQMTINNWVKDKTMGKISSILSDAPNPITEVIITSALYFGGEWHQHFISDATKKREFTIEPAMNNKVIVDMMFNAGDFPFYEDKTLGASIVGLPYKGYETMMYVILPNKKGAIALRDFKRRLTADTLEKMIGNMRMYNCIIGFPKMKLSSTLNLKSALRSLGLVSLFDPSQADLSLLSPGKGTGTEQPRNPNPTFENRLGDKAKNKRKNYFRYEDKKNGYVVEQWHNGFSIKRIVRRRRRAVESDEREEFSLDPNQEVRFLRDVHRRPRRQSRPIDREFIAFLNSAKLPNYGLDELRNSPNIRNPGLYADDVIHKVEMMIDEKGTEAAAATSVILDKSGDVKRFVADRPFLFFIRHNPTKIISFWGTVNTPEPHY